jgi:hypothetical protein
MSAIHRKYSSLVCMPGASRGVVRLAGHGTWGKAPTTAACSYFPPGDRYRTLGATIRNSIRAGVDHQGTSEVGAMNGLIGRPAGTAGMVRNPVDGSAMSAFRTPPLRSDARNAGC